MIRILGLDPGFANLGWAKVEYTPSAAQPIVVIGMGLVETAKSDKKKKIRDTDDSFARSQEIVRSLDPMFAWADAVAAEEMSSPRNSRTVKLLGMAWGVVATLAEIYEHPLVQIPVMTLKKEVANDKTATKDEIIEAVNQILGEDLAETHLASLATSKHEHPYDGLAAILCSLKTDVIRMAVKLKE
jgi:Holliday junction resolvasome RuvABC endonuclease subunit